MPLRNSFEMQAHVARLMEPEGYKPEDFIPIGEPILRFDGETVIAGYAADSQEHGHRIFVYSQWEQGRAAAVCAFTLNRVLQIGDAQYPLSRDRILSAYATRYGAQEYLDETYSPENV